MAIPTWLSLPLMLLGLIFLLAGVLGAMDWFAYVTGVALAVCYGLLIY